MEASNVMAKRILDEIENPLHPRNEIEWHKWLTKLLEEEQGNHNNIISDVETDIGEQVQSTLLGLDQILYAANDTEQDEARDDLKKGTIEFGKEIRKQLERLKFNN